MKVLSDYTNLSTKGDALVQMDKDFENKLISLEQLLFFNTQVIDFFINKFENKL